jgi:hypothetical protein
MGASHTAGENPPECVMVADEALLKALRLRAPVPAGPWARHKQATWVVAKFKEDITSAHTAVLLLDRAHAAGMAVDRIMAAAAGVVAFKLQAVHYGYRVDTADFVPSRHLAEVLEVEKELVCRLGVWIPTPGEFYTALRGGPCPRRVLLRMEQTMCSDDWDGDVEALVKSVGDG